MISELEVMGLIVDSWVESLEPTRQRKQLVLQIAPRGGMPGDLVTIEAPAALVPDKGWLQDLGENTCYGSPVSARCQRDTRGRITAHQLELAR